MLTHTRVRTKSKDLFGTKVSRVDRLIRPWWDPTHPYWRTLAYSENDWFLRSRVSETMHDSPVPGVGAYPERSCAHFKNERTLEVCPYAVRDPDYEQVTWTNYPFTLYSVAGHLGESSFNDYDRPDLLAEVLEEYNPVKQAVEGLPFLGEFRSTVSMIHRPFNFLSSLPRGARQTPLGKHLRQLGLGPTSSAWLQFNYGWKPLFGDLMAISETLGSLSDDYASYCNGVDPRPFEKNKRTDYGTIEQSFGDYSRVKTSRFSDTRVTGLIQVLPAKSTYDAMSYGAFRAHRLGLTADNLASLAWELTPYSFVVDWFIPVGRTLSRLKSTPCNLSLPKSSYHYTESVVTEEVTSSPPFSIHDKTNEPLGFAVVGRNKDTAYWRNDPDYGPSKAFRIGTGLQSTSRILSALSLIAQKLMMPLPRRK